MNMKRYQVIHYEQRNGTVRVEVYWPHEVPVKRSLWTKFQDDA